MNYNIRIDLSKLKNTIVTNIKGRTATKRCLLIPIDEADLFLGEKGVYLDVVAWEQKEQKYGSTHYVKQSLSKEKFDAMTEEQRKALPILGSASPIQRKEMQITETYEASAMVDNPDDLPF